MRGRSALVTATKSCLHPDRGRMNELVRAAQADPAKARFTFSTQTRWVDGAATETTARGKTIQADESGAGKGGQP